MKHKPLTLSDYANLYSAIHNTGISKTENYMKNNMVSTILTQYHVSEGLKLYGEKGVDVVLKELKQHHNRHIIEPKFSKNMSLKVSIGRQKNWYHKRARMCRREKTETLYL